MQLRRAARSAASGTSARSRSARWQTVARRRPTSPSTVSVETACALTSTVLERLSCPEGTYPKQLWVRWPQLWAGAGFDPLKLASAYAARCVASWRTGMEPTQFERLKQALKLQKERGAITLDEYPALPLA